jgi:MYXO-CTERM domain-containing protein
MSKVIGLLWGLSLGLSLSNVAQADISSGLVGHWTLDDAAASTSIADTSGGGNDGLSGSLDVGGGHIVLLDAPTLGVPGKFGGAGSFDGVVDAVRVNNVIGDTFTVAAWINTSDPGEGSAGAPAYAGHGIVWSDIGGDAPDMVPMAIVGGQLVFGTGGSNPGEYDTLASQSAVNTGVWLHVAITRDMTSGAKQVYINGNLENSSTGGTDSLNANPYIAFGANPLDGRYFAGVIDDVYFFDRVLSAADIAQLMAGPVTEDAGAGDADSTEAAVDDGSVETDAGVPGDGSIETDAGVPVDASREASEEAAAETGAPDAGPVDATAPIDSGAVLTAPDGGGDSGVDLGASASGSGCGCRIDGANGSSSWPLLALLAVVFAGLRRRRVASRASHL